MAKKKKNKVETVSKSIPEKTNIFETIDQFLSGWKGILLFIITIGIILSFFYAPMAFGGKSPSGVDVLAGVGKTHQVVDWEKNNDQRVLWNPYVFGGMPLYHRITPVVYSLDSLIFTLGKLINSNFLLF